MTYRVPVITGSLTDFSATLEKDVSVDEVKAAFREAAGASLSNVLEYADEPLVSTDIMGNKHSCIFDSLLTDKAANTIKIVGWYDNESGYSQRTADLIDRMRAFL